MPASSLPHAMAHLLNDVCSDKIIESPPSAAETTSVGSAPLARYASSSRYATREANFPMTASGLPHAMAPLLNGTSDDKSLELTSPAADFQHHREVHASLDGSEDDSEIIPSVGAGHSSSAGPRSLAGYASSAGDAPSVGYSQSESEMDQNIEDDAAEISSGGPEGHNIWLSEPARNISMPLPKASLVPAEQPKSDRLKRRIDEMEKMTTVTTKTVAANRSISAHEKSII